LSPSSYDYTKGKLDGLVDTIIESGAKLFVSAVGVPPKAVVEKLHKHGVLYMNMVGHPKHVQKALNVGCDIICAQGGEGGGHTGDVPTTVLIPACVQICKGKKSPLTGKQVEVIAAGGIHDGKMLAASLMMGAGAVWVGTRFILADEAGAPQSHKESVRTASFDDTIRTLIFTGRPLRVRTNAYIENWETERQAELKELTAKGILPFESDLDRLGNGTAKEVPGVDIDTSSEDAVDELMDKFRPELMGKCAALVNEQKSAKAIVDEFIIDATAALKAGTQMTAKL
jgi:NAD(P)H-dependent flavin oxidoreductase YrpB (nitropropane dioxygenase family)